MLISAFKKRHHRFERILFRISVASCSILSLVLARSCNRFPAYANAAVMIAMEYTSEALHPRDRSLIGAFKPSKIGP